MSQSPKELASKIIEFNKKCDEFDSAAKKMVLIIGGIIIAYIVYRIFWCRSATPLVEGFSNKNVAMTLQKLQQGQWKLFYSPGCGWCTRTISELGGMAQVRDLLGPNNIFDVTTQEGKQALQETGIKGTGVPLWYKSKDRYAVGYQSLDELQLLLQQKDNSSTRFM